MTNLMQDGAAWLGQRLKPSAGLAVTYQRGQQSISITATPDQHEHEVTDQSGFATQVLSYEWTVMASDLVLNGATILPRPGDRIVVGSDTYDVTTLGSLPCFERLDSYAILYTIHSKRTKDA